MRFLDLFSFKKRVDDPIDVYLIGGPLDGFEEKKTLPDPFPPILILCSPKTVMINGRCYDHLIYELKWYCKTSAYFRFRERCYVSTL